ncbi:MULTISPECIES: hypothetical protein [Bacillus cereus group]|uniref:Uncharacterized protein n=1 Tax=Bacillus cereus TaxID=1396 RepID=A0A2C1LB08_BACCE|nr:hypothetical protein [Bacillus thuringiensis]PGT95493.1 hypothetical protein COD19_29155 [Bacillus cereus]
MENRNFLLVVQRKKVVKLTNSYKLVSFNVVVVTTYKRCHTVTTKLTNLCYLKIDELKALDCYFGQQVLF